MLNQLDKSLLVAITMNFYFNQTERQHLPEDFEVCLLQDDLQASRLTNSTDSYFHIWVFVFASFMWLAGLPSALHALASAAVYSRAEEEGSDVHNPASSSMAIQGSSQNEFQNPELVFWYYIIVGIAQKLYLFCVT